jgi:hypothetical protein
MDERTLALLDLAEHGGEVVEDLLGLRLDAHGHLARERERQLARGEEPTRITWA